MKKVIFLFVILFAIVIDVSAKEYVEYNYINIYYNGIYNGVLKSYNLGYKEHDGIPVYTIDYGLPISGITGYDVYNLSEVDMLTPDQKKYIELISYFGYKYMNHNDMKHYMAAQDLIWGCLGVDTYWTYTRHGSDFIDITEYKMDVLNAYSDYLNENNFTNEYYSLEIGNSYYFDLPINRLHNYEYYYSGLNNIFSTPNELLFDATFKENEKVTLVRNFDRGFESKIFIEPGNQTLIKVGSIPPKTKVLNLDVYNSYIYLKRINSQSLNNTIKLNGAIYEIYNEFNDLINTLFTNDFGELIIGDLPLGTYKIKEVQASYGYVSNKEVITFPLNWNETPGIINIEVIPIKKLLTITNLYIVDGIQYSDSNIEFEIYKDDILLTTIETDNDGIASIYLEYGSYKIKQINTREWAETRPMFEVIVDENTDDINYVFTNEMTTDFEEENIIEPIEITLDEEVIDSNEIIESTIIDDSDLVIKDLNDIEFEESNNIVEIDELPQLYENRDIWDTIYESIFYFFY